MNWIDDPTVSRVAWTLTHFLWQGTFLGAVAVGALRVAGSARGRYAASAAVLLSMALSPVFTFAWLGGMEAAGTAGMPWAYDGELIGRAAIELAPAGMGWQTFVTALWAAGVVVMALRLAGGWLVTRRISAAARVVDGEWAVRASAIAARLGYSGAVRLRQSARVSAPAVLGWLRPVVVVPAGFFLSMPASHIDALLAHEIAHILRFDPAINTLQCIAEVVLFYHPAVWWLSAVVRREREHCADELAAAATGEVKSYAEALVSLEEMRSSDGALLAVRATGSDLRLRIARLLGREAAGRPNATVAVLSCAAALAVLTGFQLTRATAEPQAAAAPAPAPASTPTAAKRPSIPTQNTPAMNAVTKQRLSYANERFAEPGKRGSETERGKLYMRFGPPDTIESHPALGYEKWFYKEVAGVGRNVSFEFDAGDRRLRVQAAEVADLERKVASARLGLGQVQKRLELGEITSDQLIQAEMTLSFLEQQLKEIRERQPRR